MPRFMKIFQNSKLQSFLVNVTPYDVGSITMLFADNISQEELAAIKQIEKTVPEIQISSWSLTCSNAAHAEKVYEHLKALGHFSDQDRSELAQVIQEVNKIIAQRNQIKDSFTPLQREAMFSIASIYIDDIIDNSKDYHSAVILLRCAFCQEYQPYEQQIKKLLEEEKMDENVLHSVEPIWKIARGLGDMESTYIRFGTTLPSIRLQRIVLKDYIIEKLLKKFNNLDDENNLYMVLGFMLFLVEYQNLSPFCDTAKLVQSGLKQNDGSISKYKAGNDWPIWDPMIIGITTHAFGKIGLLTQNGPQLDRIIALQKLFSSPVLQNYLNNMKKTKSTLQQQAQDPLFKGLTENNATAVRTALKNGAQVDQFFHQGGATPLMLAVKCGPEMVRTVLEFKPDVNQLNSFRISGPIYSAILHADLETVQLLLGAGANLHIPCGAESPPTALLRGQNFLVPTLPLTAALQTRKEKNAERKDIVKCLLHHGAGIGHNFTKSQPELDRAVIIGGSCPVDSSIKPITTAKEFIELIPTDQYSHWQRIFNLALNNPQLKLSPAATAEIMQILAHIEKVLKDKAEAKETKTASAGTGIKEFKTTSSPQDPVKNAILAKMHEIIGDEAEKYALFLQSINNSNYSQALRRACTSNDAKIILLIKALFSFADKIVLNINECVAGGKSALQYAKDKATEEVYKYLVAISQQQAAVKTPSPAVESKTETKVDVSKQVLKNRDVVLIFELTPPPATILNPFQLREHVATRAFEIEPKSKTLAEAIALLFPGNLDDITLAYPRNIFRHIERVRIILSNVDVGISEDELKTKITGLLNKPGNFFTLASIAIEPSEVSEKSQKTISASETPHHREVAKTSFTRNELGDCIAAKYTYRC